MELMEELYTDDKIRIDCESIEEYIDNHNEIKEPLFTRIIFQFQII